MTGNLPPELQGLEFEDPKPYDEMTHEELIECLEAHDGHHNEHHEHEAELAAENKRLRKMLKDINNARHSDNAAMRFVPDRTDNAINKAERAAKLGVYEEEVK